MIIRSSPVAFVIEYQVGYNIFKAGGQVTDQPQRWEVRDRYGNRIYLTSERWQHALVSRPWLADFLDEALDTLRQGRRKQDPLNPSKYKYYWRCEKLLPEYNHLVVIVSFGNRTDNEGNLVSNNYVTNVWAVFIYSQR